MESKQKTKTPQPWKVKEIKNLTWVSCNLDWPAEGAHAPTELLTKHLILNFTKLESRGGGWYTMSVVATIKVILGVLQNVYKYIIIKYQI
jgi:adenine specific DNA methylase Mod